MKNEEQKIVPHLWFEGKAEEAAEFYVSVFNNSEIGNMLRFGKASAEVSGQPEGSVLTVEFMVEGYKFVGLNGGPAFKKNPSVSFFVNCSTKEAVDELWEKLSDGGTPLMPLDSYPFSERYGWIQDKYGVSWQLIYGDPEEDERPPIIPSLMYVTESGEAAEEAVSFYLSVFKDSEQGQLFRYPADTEEGKEGAVMFMDFKILGQWFTALDANASMHRFEFNEAISLLVYCDTQEEIDYYWEKMSASPESEQCGWIKDKYGVSWQIVPTILDELLSDPDKEKTEKVMEAMLKMKKLDVEGLKNAYESN